METKKPEEVAEPKHGAPELSYGQKAVGLTFNPSGNPDVIAIKTSCAHAIDIINDLRSRTSDGEKIAQYTLAIRQIQTGQMWAVKSVTWGL